MILEILALLVGIINLILFYFLYKENKKVKIKLNNTINDLNLLTNWINYFKNNTVKKINHLIKPNKNV
jgi:hypothetical protein